MEQKLCDKFTYNESSGNLTVTGYDEFDKSLNVALVVIPSAADGKPVTAIGKEVFQYARLRAVYIPESVTEIGEKAFEKCEFLTNIFYEGSEENWNNIKSADKIKNPKNNLIVHCNSAVPTVHYEKLSGLGYLCNQNEAVLINYISGADTIICIPEEFNGVPVTAIDRAVFRNCEMKVAFIPKTVKNIGCFAFHSCQNLNNVYYSGTMKEWQESLVIGSNNSSVDNATVYYKSSVPVMNIWKNFVYISNGEYVVITEYTGSEVNVTVPDYIDGAPVTVINKGALSNSFIKQVHLPETIRKVNEGAFGNKELIKVTYDGSEEDWGNIVIEKNNKAIVNTEVKK